MNSLEKEMNKKIVRQSIVRLTLHEVGHTLGLNHNFKAYVPTLLISKAFS